MTDQATDKTARSEPPTLKTGRARAVIAAAVALVVGGAAIGGGVWAFGGDEVAVVAPDAAARLQPVRRMDLDIVVKQEGELAAVSNIEIRNDVEGRRTITYLVDEGTRVAKGDTLAVLESADIENEIERLEIELTQREMELTDDKEQLDWQVSQNASDIESAEVELSLARMELDKYTNGEWPKALATARSKLEKALTSLESEQEDLQTSLALFSRGFVTAKKVKTDREAVADAQREVENARISLDVLEDYEHEMQLRKLENRLRQAENSIERIKVRARSAENNRRQNVLREEERVAGVRQRLEERRRELANCTIEAPSAGLVVYHDDERNLVAEGEQTHHRQTLLLLPDTDVMKAVVRVPENRVSMLQTGMPAILEKPVEGFQPLRAVVDRISVLAESGGRWYDRDAREYPVDLVLQSTPEGLKPGLKVEATVYVEQMKDVLAVPLSCVYSQGDKSYVFVHGEGETGIEPRAIGLGRSNETHAHVADGLAGGENVLELQVGEGRRLLEVFGLLDDDLPAGDSPDVLPVETSTPAGDTATASTDTGPAAGQ